MMRVVERRAHQVVHSRIDDHEVLRFTALEIDDAGHEYPGIADEQTARLENQRAGEIARRLLDHRRVGLGVWRRLVVLAIGNAKAAAEVHVYNRMPVRTQCAERNPKAAQRHH